MRDAYLFKKSGHTPRCIMRKKRKLDVILFREFFFPNENVAFWKRMSHIRYY